MLPLLILFASILLPPEVRITIAGQTLYPYRMASLALLPWVLHRVATGHLRFRAADGFVMFAAFWIVFSLSLYYDFARGMTTGVGFALDVIVPYLIARLSIRDLAQFRRFLLIVAPVVLVVGLSFVAEAITHFRFFRRFGELIFGPLGAAEYNREITSAESFDRRFGLLRAGGPFIHPILGGAFLASLLPLYLALRPRDWRTSGGTFAALMAVFSVSSTAILGLLVAAGLSVFDRVRHLVRMNWPLFLSGVAGVLFILHMISKNGIFTVLIRYTLDPTTGYYRILIWRFGTRSVADHPWIGIGLTPFDRLPWMKESIDTYWLAMAVRHGLPMPLSMLLATLIALFALGRISHHYGADGRRLVVALAISLGVVGLLGFTVSFFSAFLTWFMVLLGIATTLGKPPERKAGGRAQGGGRTRA